MRIAIVVFVVSACAWCAASAHAAATGSAGAALPPAKSDPAGEAFFEKNIRPALAQYCYQCHSTQATKVKAGLYLDSREGVIKGGVGGPAVVPGKADASLLSKAISWQDDELQMPPKQKMPDQVVANFNAWIAMGAPWPKESTAPIRPGNAGANGGNRVGNGGTTTAPAPPNGDARYDPIKMRSTHWAWQQVKPVSIPSVKDPTWAHSDIDKLVLANLESKGLHPAPDADKVTLIRRVYFDLTGLPPSPGEVDAFLHDQSSDAYRKVVDRLLASSHFGEQWGRHWLDVARYGESTGFGRNVPFSYAWRYRDYVIDAFNKDKPFDKFITEQLAGDLLPAKTTEQRNEQLIATGFLAIGPKDLNEKNPRQFLMDNTDEQIDVVTRGFMAMTVACARCHDHKFDPIPTRDYYALAGIFQSTQIMCGLTRKQGAGPGDYADDSLLIALASDKKPASADPNVAKRESLTQQLNKAQTELEQWQQEIVAERDKLQAMQPGPERFALRNAMLEVRTQADRARQTAADLQAQLDKLPPVVNDGDKAMGVRDGRAVNATILYHGELDQQRGVVNRGVVQLVNYSAVQPKFSNQSSGRLELAQWIASPSNPLTARVAVNRIWKHLFGDGIVESVDNFGTTGEKPSNQPLLDYLAGRFVSEGWSVKSMVRQIVLSRAYQMSSQPNAANQAIDPDDKNVWRMNPRRLEAESIRDAMLSVAGAIDLDRPPPPATLAPGQIRPDGKGPPVPPPFLTGPNGMRRLAIAGDPGGAYRSVYMPIRRGLVPQVLSTFDFADPSMVMGDREVTTVPTQALFLLNSDFVLDMSRRLSQRVLADKVLDDDGRVDLAYRLALARTPTPAERLRAESFITDFLHSAQPGNPMNQRVQAWNTFCQALLMSAEFRYRQ